MLRSAVSTGAGNTLAARQVIWTSAAARQKPGTRMDFGPSENSSKGLT
jgi:hypothetical protein